MGADQAAPHHAAACALKSNASAIRLGLPTSANNSDACGSLLRQNRRRIN